MSGTDLENLMQLIAKLPGLGSRSSKRITLHLLKQKDSLMRPLADALQKAADSTLSCEICGNLDTISPCSICSDSRRDVTTICVVEEVADLWAFERSNMFKGKYHVLGGTLSALDGRMPKDLNISKLIERSSSSEVKEVIIATNATIEGQTTAHYINELLGDKGIIATKLAHGIPIGGELDYLDEGTIVAALKARSGF